MVKHDVDISSAFGALADKTRRRMVERLVQEGPMPISKLASPFDMSLPAASKHVRVLRNAKIINCKKEGRTTYCVIHKKSLSQVTDWLTTQEKYWESSFSRLEKTINKNKLNK